MVRFSVVVPAYNAAATLSSTLDALLEQSLDDWECVIVDDGSTDDTLAIARGYAADDSRFRVLSQPNAGTGGAYNTGVSGARGEYVVLCSADDILLPEHLAEMAALIAREPGFDIYSTNGFLWTPEGDVRRVVYQPGEVAQSWSLEELIDRCFYSVGATYRRGLFDSVGGYRTAVFGEDYDFWLRAMAQGARHCYLSTPLALHRVSTTQKSADLVKAYTSDIRLLKDLRSTVNLSAQERQAVARRITEARAIIAGIRKENRLHRIRLLRASDAAWLRPVRRVYRAARRLAR
ncbi:MAG: glycosyltransferase [Coriobacteriia bacterium]|nr:glycosyltransferase [Coriobacteriia bacterium]